MTVTKMKAMAAWRFLMMRIAAIFTCH
jgi:hypothetical protein